jgi:hypothetical protein
MRRAANQRPRRWHQRHNRNRGRPLSVVRCQWLVRGLATDNGQLTTDN